MFIFQSVYKPIKKRGGIWMEPRGGKMLKRKENVLKESEKHIKNFSYLFFDFEYDETQ